MGFRQVMQACRESGELVGIHLWKSSPDCFLVGIIEDLGEEGFSFRDVDTCGTVNDLNFHTWADLVQVDRGSRYLRRLALLMRDHETVFAHAIETHRGY